MIEMEVNQKECFEITQIIQDKETRAIPNFLGSKL